MLDVQSVPCIFLGFGQFDVQQDGCKDPRIFVRVKCFILIIRYSIASMHWQRVVSEFGRKSDNVNTSAKIGENGYIQVYPCYRSFFPFTLNM